MTDNEVSKAHEGKGILSASCLQVDQGHEILTLRPSQLSGYIGQEEVVETLKIAIEAAL